MVTITTASDFLQAVWTLRMDGISSGAGSVGYFKLTAP